MDANITQGFSIPFLDCALLNYSSGSILDPDLNRAKVQSKILLVGWHDLI